MSRTQPGSVAASPDIGLALAILLSVTEPISLPGFRCLRKVRLATLQAALALARQLISDTKQRPFSLDSDRLYLRVERLCESFEEFDWQVSWILT